MRKFRRNNEKYYQSVSCPMPEGNGQLLPSKLLHSTYINHERENGMESHQKTIKSRILLLILCFFIVTLNTGCQKKENSSNSSDSAQAFSMEALTLEQDLQQITAMYCTEERVYLIGEKGGEKWLGSMDLEGKNQKWEQITGLDGKVSALAADGKGNFRILIETFQINHKQYNITQADYQEGTGSITKNTQMKLKTDHSPVVSMDMNYTVITEDQEEMKIYGSDYGADGKKIPSVFMDTLFVENGIIWSVVSGTMDVQQWDIKNAQKTHTFSTGLSNSWIKRLFPAGEGDYLCYLENETGIYGCLKEGKNSLLFSWTEAGIIENDLGSVTGRNGIFFAADSEGKLYRIAEGTDISEEHEENHDIVMATLFVDISTQRWINEFNASQEEYYIKLKSYAGYENPEERLKLDITSGKAPDIIEIFEYQNPTYILDELGRKGWLEDLYPYLDKDGELSREDIMQIPLKLSETDGKLERIVPVFSIHCVAADKKILGNMKKLTWNWEEYASLCRTQPKKNIYANFYGSSGNSVWITSFWSSWQQYFDFSTGEVHFNDGEFEKQLTLAKEISGTEEHIDEGKAPFLCDIQINNDFLMEAIDKFGKDGFLLMGFPTDSGTGVAVEYPKQYAVLSTSKHKEGAWQFLRSLWMEENQQHFGYGIPITKKGFDFNKECIIFTKDIREGYVNENGYYVYPCVPKQYLLTKRHLNMIDEIIELADTEWMSFAHPVNQILYEEVPQNERTIRETADIIQSRVSLYINEQR